MKYGKDRGTLGACFVAMMWTTLMILPAVGANGGVFTKYNTSHYLLEEQQIAVIDHNGESQRMLLSIDLEWKETNSTAWIFPLPSVPDSLDIANDGMVFTGNTFYDKARTQMRDNIAGVAKAYAGGTLSPLPTLIGLGVVYLWTSDMAGSHVGSIAYYGGGYDVDVHMHMEKHGLTAEVISTPTGEEIYGYLTGRGLDMERGMFPVLDDYIEDEYVSSF